jgi:hypothetical protein
MLELQRCIVCDTELKKVSKFKPRVYCSDTCCDYMKYKNALERALLRISPTSKAKSLIRGDKFRLANLLSKRTDTKSKSLCNDE